MASTHPEVRLATPVHGPRKHLEPQSLAFSELHLVHLPLVGGDLVWSGFPRQRVQRIDERLEPGLLAERPSSAGSGWHREELGERLGVS